MPCARSRYPDPVTDPIPERGSRGRSIALGVVVFVATLILLFGVLDVVRPADVVQPGASGSVAGVKPPLASPASASNAPSPTTTVTPTAEASAAAASPSASASASSDAVLVGAGDIADCDVDADAKTAALVKAIPGTVFTAGDNAYPSGSAKQFKDCYDPTWGQFLDRTRPAPGNHDWETPKAAGYLGYFGKAAAPNGTDWYSYDLGTWHVIVLDSDCSDVGGCGASSPQGRWLAADLHASTAACTLAIWHHPRFSSGMHGNDKEVAPFWTALYAAGADVIVNGHDHDYERFAPQDPNGLQDRSRGIREFVVGTGGRELREFDGAKLNSELRYSVTHGIIRFDLHPGSYDWTFSPTSGDFSDSGSGHCH